MTVLLQPCSGRDLPESTPEQCMVRGPALGLRRKIDQPEAPVGDVLEGHRHDPGRSVDRHLTEELQPEAGREIVALLCTAAIGVDRARTERVVEPAGSPGAGMERPGDEFPERVKI